MKRKYPWITALAVCVLSLAVGASFHGLRMHPENAAGYRLGCTMGIVMASIAGAALVAFVVLFCFTEKAIAAKEKENENADHC